MVVKSSFNFNKINFLNFSFKNNDERTNNYYANNNVRIDEKYHPDKSKDEKFWREYKNKMKRSSNNSGPLDSQEFLINDTIHSWKYSKRHSLLASEIYDELVKINSSHKPQDIPFLLLDIREESEFEIYKFPYRNKNGGELPIILRNVNELNLRDFTSIPFNKYIVIIDSIGLRSRRVAHQLATEGYLTLYVEGGLDLLMNHIKNQL